ncbi:energy transducer TonB [Dyella ginsengisoli]|uniref:energy transducer TonB n=1 Tax=Dyella ginsengisoli TaxID=363848 RepID=UPI000346CB64|nr:energy transducer TonB [Dyella ginsengisoli]
MKKIMFAALLALTAAAAYAGPTKNLESSAVVDGTIVLAKDGSVQLATVEHPEKYGQPIADLVRKVALTWHFDPVLRDGQPVLAKASMHVRVILTKNADGNFTARIKGATFGGSNEDTPDNLYSANQKTIAPHYPMAAIKARVQGSVYLALHIDREGHVTDAVAEQVNLENTGPDGVLRKYRKLMAQASLDAARRWTYRVPTTGRLASQDSWTVHVPIVYTLNESGAPRVDRVWRTYVPGPYTPAPWVDKPSMATADALADDGSYTEGAGPVLRSSFDHG